MQVDAPPRTSLKEGKGQLPHLEFQQKGVGSREDPMFVSTTLSKQPCKNNDELKTVAIMKTNSAMTHQRRK